MIVSSDVLHVIGHRYYKSIVATVAEGHSQITLLQVKGHPHVYKRALVFIYNITLCSLLFYGDRYVRIVMLYKYVNIFEDAVPYYNSLECRCKTELD